MLEYAGKAVLAPMVRAGELPTRLLALKYGADLVWSPEIVDRKIIGCVRTVNDKIGCIDYVDTETTNTNRVALRIHPERERGRLVLQLGTASPELAVKAAAKVAPDVAAIDVNAGCPMHFSVHSGMGSALLGTPDKLVSILEALVKEVGIPFEIPISVKIRLLDDKDPQPTCALVSRLVATGIRLLTVHCRTIRMRPREPALRFAMSSIADICHKAGVACYMNGDVARGSEVSELMKFYGIDGVMLARSAEANPSVFRPEGPLPWPFVAQEYLRAAKEVDHYYHNTKYCLTRMVPGKHPIYQQLSQSKSIEQLWKVVEPLDASSAAVPPRKRSDPSAAPAKRQKTDAPVSDSRATVTAA